MLHLRSVRRIIADRSVGSRAQANPRGHYRALLGQPVLRGLAVADVCARLPQGMVSITLLLVAAELNSIMNGGAAGGAALAGLSSGQPVLALGVAAVTAAAAALSAVAGEHQEVIR